MVLCLLVLCLRRGHLRRGCRWSVLLIMYGAGALAVMLPRGPVVSTRGVLWLAACLRLAVDIIGGYHLVGVWGCVVGLVVGMGCSDVDTLPMPVVAGLLAAACVPFEGPQDRYQGGAIAAWLGLVGACFSLTSSRAPLAWRGIICRAVVGTLDM